jgi:pimeloyl-ACP methyl ester carboxylesterase
MKPLASVSSGSPVATTRILLIHGLAADGSMFTELSATLVQAGWFVTCPDLRGFGASAARPGPFTVTQHAHDLEQFLSDLVPAQWLVLGYSQGGLIAQYLARRRPDLVAGLILCNSFARNVASLQEGIEAWLLALLGATFSMDRIGRLLWTGLTAHDAVDPALRDWFVQMVCRTNRAALGQMLRELRRCDTRPWLHELQCPTLLIRGANDHAVPAHHLRELQQYLPHAEVQVIPGVGHGMAWSAPATLGRTISAWWERVQDI